MSAQGHHEAKAPIRSLKFSVSNEGYRWKDYSEKNVEVKQRKPKFRSRLKKVAIFTWWTKISVMFLSNSRWARITRNARNQKISFLSVCLFLHSSSLSSHFGVPLACSVGFLTLRSSRSFIQPAIFTFDLEVKVVAGRGGGEVHSPTSAPLPLPPPLSIFLTVAYPLVQISFSPQPSAAIKKKMAAIIFDKKILSLLCRLVFHLTSYWISNVKGVVWVNRTREKVNFELGDDMKKADFSVLSRAWSKDKTSFFSSLLCSKFTIFIDPSAFFIFLNYSLHTCSPVLLHVWCFGKPGKYVNYSPFEDATGSTLV